jgi:uncharacterized protein YdeI (YjbR/CyaY-like superfamily)
MAPVKVNKAHIHAFKDQNSLEAWYRKNHDKANELWLKIGKKASGLKSVTNAESLDVALMWGWIDGLRKSLDDKCFLQRYTPRGKKSIWSQINRDHVARLTKAGKMTAFGFAQVEAAKADGRWAKAYASGSKLETPDDLLAAIAEEPKALEMYRSLNAANRYALAFRLHHTKSDAGRKKKIETFVEMLRRGATIYPQTARGSLTASARSSSR